MILLRSLNDASIANGGDTWGSRQVMSASAGRATNPMIAQPLAHASAALRATAGFR